MTGKVSIFFLLACFVLSSTIYTIDAAKAVPPWQDLLIHDCSHGLHFLPSSDLSMSFDGSMFNTIANHILAEVKKRAKCGSADMATRKNIVCNYIPSVEMFMENFVHAYEMDTSAQAKFNGFPKRNFFNKQNPMFRAFGSEESRLFGGLFPTSGGWISLSKLWPESCNVEKFINGEPCFVQLDFEKQVGAKLGFTVQKCPNEKQFAPYFALTCSGNSCEKFLMPCVDDKECGNGAVCYDVLKTTGTLSTDDVLSTITNDITSNSGKFGLGLAPNSEKEIAKMKTAMSDLKQCIINDYTKNMNFAWKYVYKVKNFIRKNLFRQTDDFKESLNGQMKFCWPEKLHPDNINKLGDEFMEKFKMIVAEQNQTSDKSNKEAARKCVAKGCNFQKVGDWVCDPECNNVECHWDEGDCDLPSDREMLRTFDRNNDAAFVVDIHSGVINEGGYSNVQIKAESLASNVLRYCGDKKCNKFTAFICKQPFCNPKDTLWDDGKTNYDTKTTWNGIGKSAYVERTYEFTDPETGKIETKKERYFPSHGFFNTINEEDYCKEDCTGGKTATGNLFVEKCNDPNDPTKLNNGCGQRQLPFDDSESGYNRRFFGGRSSTQAIDQLSTADLTWNSSFAKQDRWILPWDGSLPDGTKSNSVKRRYGIRYKAPKASTTLSSNEQGQTFMKAECDGTFGWGTGNGFHFLVRVPGVYKLFNMLSQLFKYTQSCRYEINRIGDISENVFRANWEFWNPMNGALLRYTQSSDGQRPSLSSVEDDRKFHKPYAMLPYPSEIKFEKLQLPKEVCEPNAGRECESKDGNWRITMPETCTYEVFEKYGMCRMKFTGLTELLGTPSELLFEMNRCSAKSGLADSLFAGALVMTGDVATTFSPMRWCEDDKSCKKSQKCVDFSKLTNLDDAVEPKTIGDTKSISLEHQFLRDPFAAAVYGMKGTNEQCIQKNKPIQNSIRNLLRKMGNLPPDQKTDIKVCVPSWAVDVSELTKQGETFIKNRFQVVNNGLVVNGLQKTGKSALFYGLDKYKPVAKSGDSESAKGPTVLAAKADEGYVYQTVKMEIDGGSKDTTCEMKDSIKRGVIKHLKKKIPSMNYLTEKDILLKCESARRRRMLLSSKVQLSISIQLKSEKKEELAKQVSQAVSEDAGKADIAQSMAESGVILADGTPVSATAIKAIEAPEKTVESVEVSTADLGEEVSNAISEKKNNDENSKAIAKLGGDTPIESAEEDEKKSSPTKEDGLSLTVILIIAGVSVCVLCMCFIGTAVLFYYVGKNKNTKQQATQNPIYEMRASDLSMNKTTQNQMRVAM